MTTAISGATRTYMILRLADTERCDSARRSEGPLSRPSCPARCTVNLYKIR